MANSFRTNNATGRFHIVTLARNVARRTQDVVNLPLATKFYKLARRQIHSSTAAYPSEIVSHVALQRRYRILSVEHRQHKRRNNRAELSHQPTRQRERQTRRFRSPGHAPRFRSAQGPINNAFHCQRNRLPARRHRHIRTQDFRSGVRSPV